MSAAVFIVSSGAGALFIVIVCKSQHHVGTAAVVLNPHISFRCAAVLLMSSICRGLVPMRSI